MARGGMRIVLIRTNKYIYNTTAFLIRCFVMDLKEVMWKINSSNGDFIDEIRRLMQEKKYSTLELSKASNIPESTLYKIMSNPKKDFRISTFRAIMRGIIRLEGYGEEKKERNVIAVISSREALDNLGKHVEMNGRTYTIKEYPATTIEEEIIQGVKAERDGALGILCGPVAATTISKVVRIPVTALRFVNTTLFRGLEKLSQKI